MFLVDMLLGACRVFWALMNLIVDAMLGFGADEDADFDEDVAPDLEEWDTLGPYFDWHTMEGTVDRIPFEKLRFPSEKL